ncbi:hypothetical protein CSUI_001114 [Cystoisospora suis]|uniref:Uncharacterized protein n=1 Tax=Cystoisospora suis TaxID=483139 RepID=A0A2C6LDI1_9APIC|nr:hypothetical protein CSUI_001114 [Cystoisospora suis]
MEKEGARFLKRGACLYHVIKKIYEVPIRNTRRELDDGLVGDVLEGGGLGYGRAIPRVLLSLGLLH